MTRIDQKKIKEILSRNVEKVIDREVLEKKLLKGKKLRIKYGVDVTSPMLHLGHGVNLWKMREFQELGHKVVFLVGDFTTRIGDPTGRTHLRPRISQAQIERDAKAYKAQAAKILLTDPEVFEERRNASWYDKMNLADFLSLARETTYARLIERDMFQTRIKEEKEIYIHELIYPILQGYDSVMLKSDLTIIGEDQLFNELIGRCYQKVFKQSPQAIITTTITPGIRGRQKQSKSLGNYIAILDPPKEKYGRIMSIPDNLILPYFRVYTKLSLAEIKTFEGELRAGANPSELKAKLAYEIVKLYHGAKAAEKESQEFNRVFREKKLPEKIPVYKVSFKSGEKKYKLIDLIFKAKLAPSKAQARRLIDEGAVELDGRPVKDWRYEFLPESGMIIKVGKRRFIKILFEAQGAKRLSKGTKS